VSEKEVLLSMINRLDKIEEKLNRLDKIEEELKELREEMNKMNHRMEAFEKRLDGFEKHIDGVEKSVSDLKERMEMQELRFKTIIDVAKDIRKEEEKIYEMYQVREGTGFATTRKKWVRHPFF